MEAILSNASGGIDIYSPVHIHKQCEGLQTQTGLAHQQLHRSWSQSLVLKAACRRSRVSEIDFYGCWSGLQEVHLEAVGQQHQMLWGNS